jgi:hypothetical protein
MTTSTLDLAVTSSTKAALKVTAKTQVVLNDKQKRAQKARIKARASNTTNFLTTLVNEREQWQQNAYTKSNDELYGLLAKCYASFKEMCEDTDDAEVMRKQFDAYVESKGIVFKKSTHKLVKIVKCVFGETDKRRISTYGIVLRTALAKNLAASDVANFIKQSGGVQEIKLARTNALTTKAKAEIAQQTVGMHVLGELSNSDVANEMDASEIGQLVVFVATQKANGTFVINAATNSATAVNVALAAYYSKNKKAVANTQAENDAASNEETFEAALEAAAA